MVIPAGYMYPERTPCYRVRGRHGRDTSLATMGFAHRLCAIYLIPGTASGLPGLFDVVFNGVFIMYCVATYLDGLPCVIDEENDVFELSFEPREDWGTVWVSLDGVLRRVYAPENFPAAIVNWIEIDAIEWE